MEVTLSRIENILTRTTGYLKEVTSHSLQPYRGCTLGSSLCGVGCYVQHSRHLTRGRPWGSFLEVRQNAAESYLRNVCRERRWAQRARGELSIFMSSATEPFLPQERRYGITKSVLLAMLDTPPDRLVLQTHTHRGTEYLEILLALAQVCRLRIHISIESDVDRLPGLPPSASPVSRRFEAARTFKRAGLETVITVSPLLPMEDPEAFFERVAHCAGAVVIDHFVGGDGSASGSRTHRTPLPGAMAAIKQESVELAYRDAMVALAQRYLPGRVGVSADGFAGRYDYRSVASSPVKSRLINFPEPRVSQPPAAGSGAEE